MKPIRNLPSIIVLAAAGSVLLVCSVLRSRYDFQTVKIDDERPEGTDRHNPEDSTAERLIKKTHIEMKNQDTKTAGNIDSNKIGPGERKLVMIPPENLILEKEHSGKMKTEKILLEQTNYDDKRLQKMNSDNVRPELMINENIRQQKISPENVNTEQMKNENVHPKMNIRPGNIRPDELSLQKMNLAETSEQKENVRNGFRDVLSPVSLSNLTHLSAVGGMEMNDERLVSAVRRALLPPASPDEPYNLDRPRRIRNSQYEQDILVEELFFGKRNGFFFEVGAFTGEQVSNSLYLERKLGWTGVLVEPMPASFDILRKKKRKAYALNACLSPDTSATELFLTSGLSGAFAQFTADPAGPNTLRVMCVPLFTILQALGNPIVDYLSLDVEGAELTILKTIPWNRVNIRLLGIEINHVPEGREAVKIYMEKQGFKFILLQNIEYFFYKPELFSDLDR